MPTDPAVLLRSSWNADLQAYADLLRCRREDTLRLTQAEMAARLGLNQSTISRIEAGARPRHKAAALAIAEAYRLSRAETRAWLELLFGVPSLPMVGTAMESWGDSLIRVYDLLERAKPNPPPSFT